MKVKVGDYVEFSALGQHVTGICVGKGAEGYSVLVEHTNDRCINMWPEEALRDEIGNQTFYKKPGFNYWLIWEEYVVAYSLANKTGISHKLVQMYGE